LEKKIIVLGFHGKLIGASLGKAGRRFLPDFSQFFPNQEDLPFAGEPIFLKYFFVIESKSPKSRQK
jgi:hypothetical protein